MEVITYILKGGECHNCDRSVSEIWAEVPILISIWNLSRGTKLHIDVKYAIDAIIYGYNDKYLCGSLMLFLFIRLTTVGSSQGLANLILQEMVINIETHNWSMSREYKEYKAAGCLSLIVTSILHLYFPRLKDLLATKWLQEHSAQILSYKEMLW